MKSRISGRWSVGTDPKESTNGFSNITLHTTSHVIQPGELVGYVSVLSDGISDAFVLDFMVHPRYRHVRLGTRLVHRVVTDVRNAGIQTQTHIPPAHVRHFRAHVAVRSHLLGEAVLLF